MARIKIKVGTSEIEVDSRDFYVDNQSLGQVIDDILQHLPQEQPNVAQTADSFVPENLSENGMENLDDAEAYEAEFIQPKPIIPSMIKSKIRILHTSKFFDSPRTVTEIVQQLREYGWATSQLDVSKVLAKMASNKEIMKYSHENRIHYFVGNPLMVS